MNKPWLGVAALLCFGIPNVFAKGPVGGVELELQPIFGYERVQKLYPTAHQTSRLMYGARASLGLPLIGGELEYTRGQDTEIIGAQTIDETDDRVKLGLRSRIGLGRLFFVTARAGGQARRTTRAITQAGVTSTSYPGIVYYPYAGMSVGGRLGTLITLEGGVTVIFNAFPDMNQNEYQGALGFNVRFRL